MLPEDASPIAVICPSWVGDTVMATPLYRALRVARPDARITAVLRPGLEPLLDGSPWFDDIIAATAGGPLGPWRLGRLLRRVSRPEAVVLLPNSFRSALAARISGASRRLGFRRDGRGFLLTDAFEPPRARPMAAVDYYLALAGEILGETPKTPRLELVVTEAELCSARSLLGDVNGPLVLLNPGANRHDKRWPAERFADLAVALGRDDGLAIALTGSPGETALARTIVERAAASGVAVIDLIRAGIDLGSLKGVLAEASLLVTNDTGPRHVAAALGTPVVTLFGPTDHRWTTPASPTRERVLLAEPFLPETLVADQHAKACRIERIAVGDVLAAARALLHV